MEALNAVGLTPLSVLAKRTEAKKRLSIFPFRTPNFSASRTLQGSLVLLSSVLNVELSKALTYEEALKQSVSGNSSDIDVNGVVESLISFATENPLIIGGGAAILAVPLVVSQLLSKPKPWGVESAKVAYTKLGDDGNAQLLDIRAASDIKQVGSPDIRGLKKKPVTLVYKGEDKPGFLDKLSLKFKEPENTTLFILDKFDGNSELVAELVTANGFKAAYAIKDGAEGSRGWMSSGLPWILPKKTLSFDLSNFTEAFEEASGGLPLTIGVAVAAAGAGLLAFTEVETLLQLLGSAALIQFVSKKVLFAEDRKQTIKQLEEVLNTKIAPKELVGDIQEIGRALLPATVTSSKSLPAPLIAEPTPTPPAVQKPEPIPEPKIEAAQEPEVNSVPEAQVEEKSAPEPIPEPKIEAAQEPEVNSVPKAQVEEKSAEPTPTPPAVQKPEPNPEPKIEAAQEPEVNSVPKAQAEEKSAPVVSRPLSPYPNYPDFKPPSSPVPSQP